MFFRQRRLVGPVVLGAALALGGLCHLAGRGLGSRLARGDFAPVAERLAQARLVVDVRRAAVVAGQLIVVVHLDRVERAELGAEAAVHADAHVDPELLWLRLRPAVGLLAAFDPYALRRADLGADATGGTPVVAPGLTGRA